MGQFRCISLLIPLFNEKDSLSELHERIVAVMESLGGDYEVIYVNDGSTDGSTQVLDELYRVDPHVRVVHLRTNFGKAAALDAGFHRVRGDVVITMDADLQDDPAEIPRFLDKIGDGYDLVTGWKYPRHDPWTRRLASKIYNGVVRWFTGLRLHDMNCGFKAFRKEVLSVLNLYGELHRYIPVIAANYGFGNTEIKVTHHPRRHGKSKYGIWRFFSGFFDLFTVLVLTRYAARPQHVFGMAGLMLTLAGLGVTGYLLIARMFGQYLSNRPLFYLGLSLLIVGLQVVFFGFLAEIQAHARGAETFYAIREVRDREEAPLHGQGHP